MRLSTVHCDYAVADARLRKVELSAQKRQSAMSRAKRAALVS